MAGFFCVLAGPVAAPHHDRMTAADLTALFPTLLGEANWRTLPCAVQALHGSVGRLQAHGCADVTGDPRLPARALRRLLALPSPAPAQPLSLTIERQRGREVWTRRFAGRQMRSTLGRRTGSPLLYESLGPVRLGFALRRLGDTIDWQLRSLHVAGIPLPRALCGQLQSGSGVREGRYHFRIDVRLPWLGQLIAYEGWLEPSAVETPSDGR